MSFQLFRGDAAALSVWLRTTDWALPNGMFHRFKEFLDARDGELEFTDVPFGSGSLDRFEHVTVLRTFVEYGEDGVGRYVRSQDRLVGMAIDARPVFPGIRFCEVEVSGEKRRFVFVDLSAEGERSYVVAKNGTLEDVRAQLRRPTPRVGQYWSGFDFVPAEAVLIDDETTYVCEPNLLEHLTQQTLGILDPDRVEAFTRYGVPAKRGVVLYGEPGNGKTRLCRILARRAMLRQINVVYLDNEVVRRTHHRHFGELLRQAFTRSPVLIVLEDVDLFLDGRDFKEGHNVLGELLHLMDGFDARTGFSVVVTTNDLSAMDKALLRSGRLDLHVHVAPPTESQLLSALAAKLGDLGARLKPEDLSGLSGFSFADAEELSRRYKTSFLLRGDVPTWDVQHFRELAQALTAERAESAAESAPRNEDDSAGPSSGS